MQQQPLLGVLCCQVPLPGGTSADFCVRCWLSAAGVLAAPCKLLQLQLVLLRCCALC